MSAQAHLTIGDRSPRARLRTQSHPRPGPSQSLSAPLLLLAVVAWAVVLLGHATGLSHYAAHDEVLGTDAPPLVGPIVLLLHWALMSTAMMLPVAMPAAPLRAAGTRLGSSPAAAAFGAGFVAPWSIAGGIVLACDGGVHSAVAGLPVLAVRPSLVGAGLLALAGVAQLAPSTRRHLARSESPSRAEAAHARECFHAGRAAGVGCLRADGPLMLVMFAAGAQLAWMAVLAVVMAAERSRRVGGVVGIGAGLVLVAAAGMLVLDPSWGPFASAASPH